MTSHVQRRVEQLQRELARLDKDAAVEANKEAKLLSKIGRAESFIGRTNLSASTIQSKTREIQRDTNSLAAVKKRQADISKKKSEKSATLGRQREQQARNEGRERKRIADEQHRLLREREEYDRQLASSTHARSLSSIAGRELPTDARITAPAGMDKDYDFFICHASEDKEGIARELAQSLESAGARVWYDEFILKPGDSLRREIDRGLGKSRFGIVILSQAFFDKEWPQRELDGLVSLETSGKAHILPIWHKVTKDDVMGHSPSLADKVALNTLIYSVNEITDRLMPLLGDNHSR